MIDALRYLDILLFGPTVQFEARSRYTLPDSIAALSARIIPRWNVLRRLQSGLCGSINGANVRVVWHQPLMRSAFKPAFQGAFETDTSGVVLRGTIGVPPWRKVLALFSIVMAVAVAAFVTPMIEGDIKMVALLVPLAVSALLIGVALVQRSDTQRIADALDAALA